MKCKLLDFYSAAYRTLINWPSKNSESERCFICRSRASLSFRRVHRRTSFNSLRTVGAQLMERARDVAPTPQSAGEELALVGQRPRNAERGSVCWANRYGDTSITDTQPAAETTRCYHGDGTAPAPAAAAHAEAMPHRHSSLPNN